MEDQKPTIIDALRCPEFLAPAFPHIESWTNWIAFLKVLYGLPLDSRELEVFRLCTGRENPSPNGYLEVYSIIGRRGGKSRTAATIAVHEAILGGWESKLSRGEKGYIFIIAVDRNQAKIVLGYVRGLLEYFSEVIDKTNEDEIILKNGIVIGVKACSFRATRGFTSLCVICDELAFWRDENFANPAEEVIASLLPGLVEGGRLLGISTPYSKFGFLYETYKDNFSKDSSDVLVWKAPTSLMNPTFSQKKMDGLIKKDRVVFSAEFNADFRDDVSNFISEDMIRGAMDHSSLPPAHGKIYTAFIDPSGGRSDSFTLAIAHKDGDKVILDWIEERRPPFDPASIVKEFSDVMKAYGIRKATSDRYGGVWPSSAFLKHGITIEMSDLTASEIYLEFQPSLAMGRVSLLQDDRLAVQFQSLERRVRPGGKDSVAHTPGAHDDLANAVAGVVVNLSRVTLWDKTERESRLPVRRRPPESPLAYARKSMNDFMREMGGGRFIKPKTL